MNLVLIRRGSPFDIAHVEFKSGTKIDTIDERTMSLAGLSAHAGSQHVESVARRESSQLTITTGGGLDDAGRPSHDARPPWGSRLTDAFVYLPEDGRRRPGAGGESYRARQTTRSAKTTRHARMRLRSAPWASQVVV